MYVYLLQVSIQFPSQKQFKGSESKHFMDLKCGSGKGLDAPNKSDHILDLSDANKERTPTTLRLWWKKLEGIASKVGGSVDIFCALFGNGLAEDTFWLDNSIEDHVSILKFYWFLI